MLVPLAILGCRSVALMDAPPAQVVEVGVDEGAGNVLGVQAWMDPTAWSSADAFDLRLRELLDTAREQDLLRPDTVVVLPEHLATWLVVVDEPYNVISAPTVDKALRRMIPRHLGRFLSLRADAPAEDRNQYALFALKAEEVAATWVEVSTALAVDYQVNLVAGSALLPGPELIDGELTVAPGEPLRNVSFVVGADGSLLPELTVEAFPDADELDVVEPGAAASLEVTQTPLGPVAVLLGDDAWYPTAWAAMAFGAPRVAVGSHYTSPDGAWSEPWEGYTGFEPPSDVDPDDVRQLSLSEAERRYGLPGRLEEEGLSFGLSVPLRGHIWDLGSDGAAVLVHQGQVHDGPLVDGPVLANLWLPAR
ncbi:hypothetical protein L6R53_08130 [Myxococcota bacterium]|nr:hypothetical protein [Myxococcota bacterium]